MSPAAEPPRATDQAAPVPTPAEPAAEPGQAASLPPEVAAAAARGWAVIPVAANKRPMLSGWKQYQQAAPARADLERWQRMKPPAWAVLTGPVSGLVILDFDGDAGKETAARLGVAPHVRTGSGGLHAYFRHPGHYIRTLNSKTKTDLGARFPGLDIRADGGYAVFTGQNESGRYEWLRAMEPDDIATLPGDVRAYLGLDAPSAPPPPVTAPPPAPAPLATPAPANGPAAPLPTRPEWIEAKIAEAHIRARQSGRNNAGFWLCLQLRDEGIPIEAAAVILGRYVSGCSPHDLHGRLAPYTAEEAEASLRKAYEAPRREPARNPAKPAYQPRQARQARSTGQPAPVAHQVSQSATVEDNAHREPPPTRGASAGRPAKDPRKCLCTDLGNAERLFLRHGRNLRYSHPMKAWLVWDGRRWKEDDTAAAERMAHNTVRAIWDEALKAKDAGEHEECKMLREWAHKSEGAGRINALLSLAQAWDGIATVPADFDADPWLLNVMNGTLDLLTGARREHRREDLITKLSPVEFDAQAEAPAWLQFVFTSMLGRAGLIEYLRRALGYALTGDVSAKHTWIAWGNGDNGKTTLLETFRHVLGDYSGSIPIESLLAGKRGSGREASPDIAGLRALRFVTTSETEDGARLNESLLKHLTGMARISARNLYGDPFEFSPQFKIWLDSNYRPTVRGQDKGIWTRLRLVPFELQLTEAQKDRSLMRKMQAEAPGILTWALSGCLDWQRDGFHEPGEVTQATADYRAGMDRLAAFLEECTEPGNADDTEPARGVYEVYHAWARGNGEHALSEVRFSECLADKGLAKRRTSRGFQYFGLRLLFTRDEHGNLARRLFA